MLSESLREMRREFQQLLRDVPDDADKVEISAMWLQSYALALGIYEDEAIKCERALGLHDAPAVAANSTVVLFRDYQKTRPQLRVVQADGNDIA